MLLTTSLVLALLATAQAASIKPLVAPSRSLHEKSNSVINATTLQSPNPRAAEDDPDGYIFMCSNANFGGTCEFVGFNYNECIAVPDDVRNQVSSIATAPINGPSNGATSGVQAVRAI